MMIYLETGRHTPACISYLFTLSLGLSQGEKTA